MGQPIATKTSGFICFAFPDVCLTPAWPSPIPIPYPNIGDLGQAETTSTNVYAGGDLVIHKGSNIPVTTGDEAGAVGPTTKGKVKFTSASKSVFVNNGQGVVRMFDSTSQNNGNAVGKVLGGCPTVFVGD